MRSLRVLLSATLLALAVYSGPVAVADAASSRAKAAKKAKRAKQCKVARKRLARARTVRSKKTASRAVKSTCPAPRPPPKSPPKPPPAPAAPTPPTPAPPAPVPVPPAPAPSPAAPAPAPAAQPAPPTTPPAPTMPPLGPTEVRTPFPAGARLFSPTSFWNAELPADAPLAATSGQLAKALSDEIDREKNARIGPWIATYEYGVPVYTVGADVPKVRVIADEPFPQLVRDWAAVPMPAQAQSARGNDQHLVVYQPSTDTMWEFWVAYRAADGWHARWGGKMENVSTNPGYFPNPLGATATSLPLVGGLITANEFRAGRIDHAVAIGIPNTAAGTVTWPAQRGDGNTTGPTAIPEGTHFRIDPSVDLTKLNLSPLGLAIARAAQRYGMVVRDTAGCVVFAGEDPATAPGVPYDLEVYGGKYPSELLEGFPWHRLQVVAPRRQP